MVWALPSEVMVELVMAMAGRSWVLAVELARSVSLSALAAAAASSSWCLVSLVRLAWRHSDCWSCCQRWRRHSVVSGLVAPVGGGPRRLGVDVGSLPAAEFRASPPGSVRV